MRSKKSSLDFVKTTNRRCDGNTTRIVDNAIQIIFSGDICVIEDHFQNNRDSKEHLARTIIRRLEIEHRWISKHIIFDKKKMEIFLDDEVMEKINNKRF